jgi:flagellar hook-associated protein 1
MSLIGALNIGKSALATHQAAINVTGNNIANAGNANYTRQVGHVRPGVDQQLRPGLFVGTGINLESVQRQIDEALEGRLRGSVSTEAGAATMHQWLSRIESVFNELSDDDLSSQLSAFFNSWSNLANQPHDPSLRQIVLQNGDSVARWLQSLRSDLVDLQKDVDSRLGALVNDADQLGRQVAELNAQIVRLEAGTGAQANGLRDQRDVVLRQLSELIDIRTLPGDNGMVNVFVGSEPLVFGTESRGVCLRQDAVDGQLHATIVFKANNGAMRLTGGALGALSEVRTQHMQRLIDEVDGYATTLMFELNRLHASGQGLEGFTSITGASQVLDAGVPLNDARSGLAFVPESGSVVVHVRDRLSGLTTSTLVQIDLDGQGGNDTTLQSLVAGFHGIDGVAASIQGGRLRLAAEGNVEISFSQDSSGVLAALGINTFFTGRDARDIAVNPLLKSTPALLAAARNGQAGDDQTALAIAALESKALPALGGQSLVGRYQAMVTSVAVATDGARRNAEAGRIVRETLHAQREALSGVSLDEEAINLMKQQRAFQGAAKLISVVDEMMRTMLNMI